MENYAMVVEISEKLGVAASTLWEALVRQALISGITDLVQYSILIGLAICLRGVFKRKLNEDGSLDINSVVDMALVIAGALTAFLLIVAFFCFPSTVAAFLNPEYWAAKEILNSMMK